MDQSKKQSGFAEEYLKVIARYLVGKVLIATTVSQPVFQVGTHRTNGLSHIEAWRTMFIHPMQGVKEAYLREIVKGLFKGPSLPIMQELTKTLFITLGQDDLAQDKRAVNLVAGSGVGFLDGFGTTPVERWKTWMVARKSGDPTFFQYLKQGNQNWNTILGKFYEGAVITTAKQTVLAMTFFACMDFYPHKTKEWFGENSWNKLTSSLLTGVTVAAVQGPLNMIKVKKQAPKGLANVSAKDIAKETIKRKGIAGMFAGAEYFAVVTIFGYTITAYLQDMALKSLGLTDEKSHSGHSR